MRRSCLLLCWAVGIAMAADKPSYQEVRKALESKSPQFAELFSAAAGGDSYKKGQGVVAEGGNFIFAVESSSAPQVVIDENEPVRDEADGPKCVDAFGNPADFTNAQLLLHG